MGNEKTRVGSKFVRVRLGPVIRWGVSSTNKAGGDGERRLAVEEGK